VFRELGSGQVGYNKHELANVMARKMDKAYLAGPLFIHIAAINL
jgi:hypothetical protein